VPFTEDQRRRITEALKARTVATACPVCLQHSPRTLVDGFVFLSLTPVSGQIPIAGAASLPCVALVCQNCGNTDLLNALVLGLSDLFPGQARLG